MLNFKTIFSAAPNNPNSPFQTGFSHLRATSISLLLFFGLLLVGLAILGLIVTIIPAIICAVVCISIAAVCFRFAWTVFKSGKQPNQSTRIHVDARSTTVDDNADNQK